MSVQYVFDSAKRRALTLPSRIGSRLSRAGRRAGIVPARPAVLMYHRITADHVDPWGLAVSPTRFDEQLQWLTEQRTLLSLPEFARLHRSARLPARAVAITFDDGYACNATTAAPLLRAHGAPATIFLTTGPLSAGHELWWDDLQRMVFTATADRLDITVDDDRLLSVELGHPLGGRAAWPSGSLPANRRQEAFMELWRAVRSLDPPAQAAAMTELRAQTGCAVEPRESHRPMTMEELNALSRSPVIDFGCHTVTHPALPEQSEAVQRTEIEQGRQACEDMTGRLPTAFAYPFGDHDPTTVELVRAAGFEAACTTEPAAVAAGCNVLALPRLQVEDWPAQRLAQELRAL